MRIGINSRIFQNGETGIPYFIKHLYSKLGEVDRESEYIFFQTDNIKRLGQTKTAFSPDNLIGNALFDAILVGKLIENNCINVFHGPAHVLPLYKRKQTKYVVTIHDLSFLVFPEQYSRIFTLYYREVIRCSLMNADAIVADSHCTKSDIVKFYQIDETKIKVIPLGVSPYLLQAREEASERIIDEPYIFSLTTHPKRKNIHSILQVLAKSEKLQLLKYVIAGLIPDDYLQELKIEICRLGLNSRVILFGYATEDQLRKLYQHAEFFIYPSFYEGFGFPILESMVCKTPVIASGTSSMSEIMPLKEWCIVPNDLHDIQHKMERMIGLGDAERKQITSTNYEFALKFRWEDTASEYLKLYKELCRE